MKKKEEQEIVKEILKLADKLGDKANISQDKDSLRITVGGDWTNGHPSKRPRK